MRQFMAPDARPRTAAAGEPAGALHAALLVALLTMPLWLAAVA